MFFACARPKNKNKMLSRALNSSNNLRVPDSDLFPSRRSKLQDSDTISYLDYLEPSKVYYSYEEFMCDKLKGYRKDLRAFCKGVKNAERVLVRNYRCPLVGLCKNRRYPRLVNRHKGGWNTVCSSGVSRSPASRAKVVIKNGKNQRLIGIEAIKRRLVKDKRNRRLTPTPGEKPIIKHRIKGNRYAVEEDNSVKTKPSTSSKKNREANVSVLVMSMAKKRRELISAERKMHRAYLKSKLDNVISNIDSTRDLFVSKSMLEHK
eukprot:TRINITY_DN3488_c0_g3_i4.p1 TRINITY_DN3488_c0_g3~~TRINITY_DN3488_c0_g3_i4.p1  ORF type:complete len:262 (-),score=38.55 TRINITY_DN3488_c0_g3_i4:81-866(-)